MNNVVNEVGILLGGDNPTDAELCLPALKKNTLADKLAWVKNVAEALEFFFATGGHAERGMTGLPKVILLVLRLPKVDGKEVLRRVKAVERTRSIPVEVRTSSMEDRDMAESYQMGVNSFISKPVEFEEFARTVKILALYWLLINTLPNLG
jgi:CheY-like chemotaxis protein